MQSIRELYKIGYGPSSSHTVRGHNLSFYFLFVIANEMKQSLNIKTDCFVVPPRNDVVKSSVYNHL
ncbi:MAG: Serine dehydratase beta chain [Bacteroidales bacterium]|nr:Serine dehydratase beta chain [Bacteroidales bacterium]